jgi:putative addiction module component (TIGR02574 family)
VAYYSYPVATEVERVVELALSLPGQERLSVARRILESIEPEAGEEVERAWEAEIIKRVEKIDSGAAKFRPWEEIKKDFDSRFPR